MSVFDDVVGNGRCRRSFRHVVYVVGDINITTLNVELVKLVKEREKIKVEKEEIVGEMETDTGGGRERELKRKGKERVKCQSEM